MFNNKKGSGFIEIMIALTIVSISMTAAIPAFMHASRGTLKNTLKTTARNIAIKKLEQIKSLDYDDVGLVGGNPDGVIEYQTTETVDGISYLLKANIAWIDDASDNLYPTDSDPRDYKRATITVSIPSKSFVKAQSFVTDITRQSEEQIASGGNIEVTVVDDSNNPIEDATVNLNTGPSATQVGYTNSDGLYTFVMLDESLEEGDYSLSVEKSGFVVNPTLKTQNTTVNVGETRMLQFILSEPGRLQATLIDNDTGEQITSQSKITLSYPSATPDTYSASTGYFDIDSLYPGSYEVVAVNDDYEMVNATETAQIEVNSTTSITIYMKRKQQGNLSLTVTDFNTGEPIPSADVLITGDTDPITIKEITDINGSLDKQLTPQTYRLQISKADYETNISNFSITANQTTNVAIALVPNAPTGGTIRVLVKRRRNERPRVGVGIRIRGPEDRILYTDDSGEALFENVQAGTYRIYRRRRGWRYVRTVTVNNGEEVTLIIRY